MLNISFIVSEKRDYPKDRVSLWMSPFCLMGPLRRVCKLLGLIKSFILKEGYPSEEGKP